MERQLQTHEYLAGDDYSIADIAVWPWLKIFEKFDIALTDFPYVLNWLEKIGQRHAVIKGINNPPRLS